jgi:hypothetical protein
MIINTKKDIAAYVKTSAVVLETKLAYEGDEPGGFAEIAKELVIVIHNSVGRPKYGTDWSDWLRDNIGEMLDEAISIVM